MAKTVQTLYIDLDARMAKLESGLNQGREQVRQFATDSRKDMMETRGAIALLGEEIGVHLPRHLRNFVAELPGVSKLMTAAFSSIAVVGLGVVAIETGKKIYEFFKKSEEAARKFQEGLAILRDGLQRTNDEALVTNDKLRNSIAALEHKPQNMLALALHEAWVEADKLAEKLQTDIQQTAKLFTEGAVGKMSALVTGKPETADFAKRTVEWAAEIARINAANTERLHAPGADPKLAGAQGRNDLQAAYNRMLLETNEQLKQMQDQQYREQHNLSASGQPLPRGMQYGPGMGQRWNEPIAEMQQLHASLLLQRDFVPLTGDTGGLQGQLAGLEGGKAGGEEKYKKLEDALKQYLQNVVGDHAALLVAEAEFWDKYLGSFAKGSDQYQKIAGHLADLHRELQTELQHLYAEDLKNDEENWKARTELTEEMTKTLQRAQQEQEAMAERAAHAAVAGAKGDAQQAYGTVNWQAQIGGMSEAAAIQARMAIADREYGVQLQAIVAAIGALGGDETDQAMKKLAALSEELAQLTSAHGETKGLLQGQLESQDWSHAFDNLLRTAANMNAELRDLFAHTVDDINNTLARIVTGQIGKGGIGQMFGKMFQGLSGDFAKVGLQGLEGSVLKGLGIHGKADGYHVHVDNLPDSGVGGGSGSGAGGDANSLWSSLSTQLGGFVSKLAGFFGKIAGAFGGFLAGGGEMSADHWYVTGEKGPEIVGGVNGRVFNSRSAAHLTSGEGGAFYYIDARDANASEIDARVNHSLAMVHGSAVATAYSTIAEAARRRPLSMPA